MRPIIILSLSYHYPTIVSSLSDYYLITTTSTTIAHKLAPTQDYGFTAIQGGTLGYGAATYS